MLATIHHRQPSIRIIPFALVIANQPSCQFSIKQPWSVPILSRLNGNDLFMSEGTAMVTSSAFPAI